uniref:Uncharacterized protein n=1 Tax=Ananas comosus var. bracteatus TaxID=296719 RepID=A0A6V7PY31_ANACO|nr:unnamed protein product [Ananas comosus var. bracteatus]
MLPDSVLKPPTEEGNAGRRSREKAEARPPPANLRDCVDMLSSNIDAKFGDMDIVNVARRRGVAFSDPPWWAPGGYPPFCTSTRDLAKVSPLEELLGAGGGIVGLNGSVSYPVARGHVGLSHVRSGVRLHNELFKLDDFGFNLADSFGSSSRAGDPCGLAAVEDESNREKDARRKNFSSLTQSIRMISITTHRLPQHHSSANSSLSASHLATFASPHRRPKQRIARPRIVLSFELGASSFSCPRPRGFRMGGDLYALDFDGILCDSCGESSLSALKLRPVVETGYENLLLVRLLLEIQIPSIRKSSVADGLSIQAILENWLQLKPVIMKEWNEERDALIDLFGKVRDEWIRNDFSGWIGANRFYPGVADALRFSSSEVYIVTTKQSRFAEALLRELAGVNIPSERIYGLGTGPKVEVLKQLQSMSQHDGLKLHFVEDRLATLKNVIKDPALDQWNLYLGRWGYNTEKEREEAGSMPRIRLLDLTDFSEKLK